MSDITRYEVACIQSRARAVSLDASRRDADIRANLGRIFELIDYVTAFGNSDVRLVVLPEYAVNARWEKLSLQQWIDIESHWVRWRLWGSLSLEARMEPWQDNNDGAVAGTTMSDRAWIKSPR